GRPCEPSPRCPTPTAVRRVSVRSRSAPGRGCSCGRTCTGRTRCSWRCCAVASLPPPTSARETESMDVVISPSILASDFANLEREIGRISSADYVHVDVMDNHFVPNLTLGLPVVERLVQVSALPVDTHLMIEDPDRWAPGFAEAGAASVTFHAEAARA